MTVRDLSISLPRQRRVLSVLVFAAVLIWIDTKSDATPISQATNGGDITASWPTDANKIAKL